MKSLGILMTAVTTAAIVVTSLSGCTGVKDETTLQQTGTSISELAASENRLTLSSDNPIIDLLLNGDDVWATTGDGVIHWNTKDGTRREYTTRNGLASDAVRKIVRDTQGNIWVTCYVSGVGRFDGERWETFNVTNGLCSDDVITMAADKIGGVWVSAYWGVSYFDGQQWASYSNVDTDAMVVGGENPMKECKILIHVDAELSAVDVIFVDSRGDVWFSDRGDGVSRFDGENWIMFTEDDGLARGGVYSIFEDKGGILWFGSHSGSVSSYDGTRFTSYTIDEYQSIVPRPVVMDITQDNQGDIWAAVYGGGVARFDGVNWYVYRAEDGLPGDNPQAIFLGDSGYPGVIIDGEVSLFDGTTWNPIPAKDDFPEGKVRIAVNDNDGNLWFGTESGVTLYDRT